MKCKKVLMGISALLILFFHFYIPVFGSVVEQFIYRTSYFGVDIFFFLSAYSIGSKREINYFSFIKNRFCYIYIPFAVMVCIAVVYKQWTLTRGLQILYGKEFWDRGGGSFLWFVIAIMLVYLVAPLMARLKNRLGLISVLIFIIVWALLATVFQYVLNQRTVFILINRLPAFILGLYWRDIQKLNLHKFRICVIIAGLACGLFIMNKWGFMTRLNWPFYDMYYVVAIPYMASFIALVDFVCEKIKFRIVPLEFIGGFTLELYGLQMIFGYDIEMFILKNWKNKLGAFILTAIILIVIAFVFKTAEKIIIKLVGKFKEVLKHEKENS